MFNVFVVLVFISDSKNVLKKIHYDKIKIQEVNRLPPRFNGTQLFVLPAPEVSSSLSRSRSMDGMDNQYDGHVWTKTQTTNITNDAGLVFRSSTCVGHLRDYGNNCFPGLATEKRRIFNHRFHRFTQIKNGVGAKVGDGLEV